MVFGFRLGHPGQGDQVFAFGKAVRLGGVTERLFIPPENLPIGKNALSVTFTETTFRALLSQLRLQRQLSPHFPLGYVYRGNFPRISLSVTFTETTFRAFPSRLRLQRQLSAHFPLGYVYRDNFPRISPSVTFTEATFRAFLPR